MTGRNRILVSARPDEDPAHAPCAGSTLLWRILFNDRNGGGIVPAFSVERLLRRPQFQCFRLRCPKKFRHCSRHCSPNSENQQSRDGWFPGCRHSHRRRSHRHNRRAAAWPCMRRRLTFALWQVQQPPSSKWQPRRVCCEASYRLLALDPPMQAP